MKYKGPYNNFVARQTKLKEHKKIIALRDKERKAAYERYKREVESHATSVQSNNKDGEDTSTMIDSLWYQW